MSFKALNTNKVVTIKKNSSSTPTWRENLSSIIENYSSAKGFIFGDSTELSSLNVEKDIELLMGEDLKQLRFASTYGTPVKDFLNKVMKIPVVGTFDIGELTTIATSAISGIKNMIEGTTSEMTSSGLDPWIKNIPAYETGSAVPFDVSYTFTFNMGQYGYWNAKKEVLLPVLNLIAPIIPQHMGTATVNGPTPSTVNLLTNVISDIFSKERREEISKNFSENFNGLNFSGFDAFLKSGSEAVSAALEAVLLSTYQSFTYDVTFGNILSLKNVILNDGVVQFSADTDQYGYPIGATVELTFRNIVPASVTSSTTNNLGIRFGKRT